MSVHIAKIIIEDTHMIYGDPLDACARGQISIEDYSRYLKAKQIARFH